MAKRRWLFRYLGVFLLLCLGAISTILSPMPCTGSESGEEPTVFSLDVKDEPLTEVLNKISKLTGYEIVVAGRWAYLPITVSIKNASIHEALNRVLRKFNHTIVVDDSKRKVTLALYDPGVIPRPQQDVVSARQKAAAPQDLEVIPPQKPGERGVTQRQLEEMQKRQKAIAPQAIPAKNPEGGEGTQKQPHE